MTRLRTTKLPSGEALPVLGQGTWRMGENARARKTAVAALRLGIALGMTLIDTAAMYAGGRAARAAQGGPAAHRYERSPLQPRAPRHRVGPDPMDAEAPSADHRLFAGRRGPSRASSPRSHRRREAARRDAGTDRPRLGHPGR